MKNSRIIAFASLLSICALGVQAQSIVAIANLSDQAPGDLILGFTSTSVANELVVDIGPANDYYSTTNASGGALTQGTTYTVTAFNAADLNTVFGSNKYSLSTFWGVISGNNLQGSGPGSEPGGTLWLTDSGVALVASTYSAQNTPSNRAENVGDNIHGDSGGLASNEALSQAKGTAASFTTFINAPGIFNTARLTTNTNSLGSGGTSILELYELQPTDNGPAGPATVDLGYFTLSTTGLTFTAGPGASSGNIQILTQPSTEYVSVGGSATFSVMASGSSSLAYQWYFDGLPISGATGSSYTLNDAQVSDGGAYKVTIADNDGSVTSNAANLEVETGPSGARLTNLSCRAGVGTGGNILIMGFVSGGTGTSGTQPVLVRGTGPALTAYGVSGVLPDPELTLYQGSSSVASNSGWGSNAAQVTTEDAAVGAFALPDTSSKDSALYVPDLSPNPYTVQIAGASGDTGVALAEVYDATPPAAYSATTPRLTNLSARAVVGTGGNILIAGFVIGGTGSETVLVRASGPALVPFGVAGTLSDPMLRIVDQTTNEVIASNNGWGGDTRISEAATQVGAFSWGTSATPDSAILIALPPGPYTAEISGASGDTGVALVEIYEAQ